MLRLHNFTYFCNYCTDTGEETAKIEYLCDRTHTSFSLASQVLYSTFCDSLFRDRKFHDSFMVLMKDWAKVSCSKQFRIWQQGIICGTRCLYRQLLRVQIISVQRCICMRQHNIICRAHCYCRQRCWRRLFFGSGKFRCSQFFRFEVTYQVSFRIFRFGRVLLFCQIKESVVLMNLTRWEASRFCPHSSAVQHRTCR